MRSKFRIVANRDDRRTLAYEKKYAKLIYDAIRLQAEQFLNNGTIGQELNPVLNKMSIDLFNYWLPYQYLSLERETKKKEGFFLNRWTALITDYVLTRVTGQLIQIDKTTKSMFQNILEVGARDGWTLGKIRDEIVKSTSGKVGKARAMMISRTEVNAAINAAKSESSNDFERETGLKVGKYWVHRGAKNPRDTHLALDNGQMIPKEMPFSVDGESMQHPHSDGASAANVVNCGCQCIYGRLK